MYRQGGLAYRKDRPAFPIPIDGRLDTERLRPVPKADQRATYYAFTTDRRKIEALPDGSVNRIVHVRPLNDVRHLNKLFVAVNEKLPEGGLFAGCVETSEQLKRRILSRRPYWFFWLYYVVIFLLKRVMPKLQITRTLYFAWTEGRNQVISKAELLGRLAYCGFEILDYREEEQELHFKVRKARPPIRDLNPSYGPLFRMKRIGQGGRWISCYKLRTMHPYAEYLQDYIYTQNKLQANGKFNDDFRITTWGRFLRKTWIDELPMFINWLRGEVKLVGVRPLSEHYLSLYPPALVERRVQYKPGLVPPFYADMPEEFEEILASEERYLRAYEAHPIRTDVRYFCLALYRIG